MAWKKRPADLPMPDATSWRGCGRRCGLGRVAGGNASEGGVLVEWDWCTVEFGDAHAGAAGVLVGGEPGPVYL